MKIFTIGIYTALLIVGIILFCKGSKGYLSPKTTRERWIRSFQLGFGTSCIMYGGFFFYNLFEPPAFGFAIYSTSLLQAILIIGAVLTIAFFVTLTSDEWKRNFIYGRRDKNNSKNDS